MKKLFALFLCAVLVLGCFAGCAYTDTASTPTQPSTPAAPEIEVISIAKALELCGESGNITTEKYYIRATIESITNPAYGQMVITDGTNSIPVSRDNISSRRSAEPWKEKPMCRARPAAFFSRIQEKQSYLR